MQFFNLSVLVEDRQAARQHEARAERLRLRRRRRPSVPAQPAKQCAHIGRPASRHA